MKKIKIFFACLSFFIFMNCNSIIEGKSNVPLPKFKIGKIGFENNLKKGFNFDKLSVGTQTNKKNGILKTDLVLTFQVANLNTIPDNKIYNYANIIKFETNKNLLKLDTYKNINITFKEEKAQGELIKSTSIKIKKELN